MTYPKEIIAKTLHLYVEGLSFSKIRDYINQHEGYYLYDGTILYWVIVRTHMGLSKTPADEAELKMPLDTNRLLNLISLSTSPLALPYSAPYVVEDAFKNPMCYGF